MCQSETTEQNKKKRGRPRKGEEYPVQRRQARVCRHCGQAESFKSNRSAMMLGVVKIEWLRCTACLRVTRFETVLN